MHAYTRKRANRTTRWYLSPFLLLLAGYLIIPLREGLKEERFAAIIVPSLLIIGCIARFFVLWGVPYVMRVVAGIVGLSFGSFLIYECLTRLPTPWNFVRSDTDIHLIIPVLGFWFFGLPCLSYCFFGRATLRTKKGEQVGAGDAEEAV